MACNPIYKVDDVGNQYTFLQIILFPFLESNVKSQNPFSYNCTLNLKYRIDWLRLSHVLHTQCVNENLVKTCCNRVFKCRSQRSTCSMNCIFFPEQ